MHVPHLKGPAAEELLGHLYPGSSVANPIDMLATGNAEQLGKAIDYCEYSFSEIDGIVVIFGTPGLAPVFDVYQVLHEKILSCSKPIYPVLPSVTTAREEVLDFLSKGHLNFQDEVILGDALTRMYQSPLPMEEMAVPDRSMMRDVAAVIREAQDGFLAPDAVGKVLDAGGIPRIREGMAAGQEEVITLARELGYPLVMKVVGPVHKSDVGGVELGIESEVGLLDHFQRMVGIDGAEGVLLQPMAEGMELFAGAKYEPGFGHLVLCGMGGIFVEAMKDVAHGLAPFSEEEALRMIRSLKGHRIMEGSRGQEGIDTSAFAALLSKLSLLLSAFPEIAEMDLNPILGKGKHLVAVDARIRIQK
jgi:acetyltransferase